MTLQKLKPAHVHAWHGTLLASGGKDGKPLSARTVGHAHRVLHRALQIAVESEVLTRNVASISGRRRLRTRRLRSSMPRRSLWCFTSLRDIRSTQSPRSHWRAACVEVSCSPSGSVMSTSRPPHSGLTAVADLRTY